MYNTELVMKKGIGKKEYENPCVETLGISLMRCIATSGDVEPGHGGGSGNYAPGYNNNPDVDYEE